MSVYAVCSACKSATRLTERLALDIARKPGPPASLCCHAEMDLRYGREVAGSGPIPSVAFEPEPFRLADVRVHHHEHGPPPAPPSIL